MDPRKPIVISVCVSNGLVVTWAWIQQHVLGTLCVSVTSSPQPLTLVVSIGVSCDRCSRWAKQRRLNCMWKLRLSSSAWNLTIPVGVDCVLFWKLNFYILNNAHFFFIFAIWIFNPSGVSLSQDLGWGRDCASVHVVTQSSHNIYIHVYIDI